MAHHRNDQEKCRASRYHASSDPQLTDPPKRELKHPGFHATFFQQPDAITISMRNFDHSFGSDRGHLSNRLDTRKPDLQRTRFRTLAKALPRALFTRVARP